MDLTTEYLSDYSYRLTYENLSAAAVHQVKRTLIDTLGCGAGAFDAEPPSIARRIASRVQGSPPARIIGTLQETSMDLAAFANTALRQMNRGQNRGPDRIQTDRIGVKSGFSF